LILHLGTLNFVKTAQQSPFQPFKNGFSRVKFSRAGHFKRLMMLNFPNSLNIFVDTALFSASNFYTYFLSNLDLT